MIRIAIETDFVGVHRYLAESPDFPYVWSLQSLQHCTLLRVIADDKTVGYCWFHQLPEPGDTVSFHACVEFDWCARWLNRRALAQLIAIGHQRGIRAVVANAHEPYIANIWHRLGAKIVGPFAILNLAEIRHGLLRRPKSEEQSNPTPDAA